MKRALLLSLFLAGCAAQPPRVVVQKVDVPAQFIKRVVIAGQNQQAYVAIVMGDDDQVRALSQ